MSIFTPLASLLLLAAPNPLEDERSGYRQLMEMAPQMVDEFSAGNAAAERGEWGPASDRYLKVLGAAPNFVPALRRVCYSLSMAARHDEARERCLVLLDRDRSEATLTSAAHALLKAPGESGAKLAKPVIDELVQRFPNSRDAQVLGCEVLLKIKAPTTEFSRCAEDLLVRYPDAVDVIYYAQTAARYAGNYALARERLKRALFLGLPESIYKQALSEIEKVEPWFRRPWVTPTALAISVLSIALAAWRFWSRRKSV